MIKHKKKILIFTILITLLMIFPAYGEEKELPSKRINLEMLDNKINIGVRVGEDELFINSEVLIKFGIEANKDNEYTSTNELSKKYYVFYNQEENILSIKRDTYRPYSYYIDQDNTGEYSNNNCGPTVATMVLKWLDRDFNITAEEARNQIKLNGENWTTDNIKKYVKENDKDTKIIEKNYTNENNIKDEIDKGNLIIACLNVKYLNQEGEGHFIVINDYIKTIDNKLYFITQDPASWGEINSTTGQFIGNNRYYNSQDIDKAIKNWWGKVMIIENNSILEDYINVEAI
ncbi:hypothetical protein SDC9_50170 [bioreactor metagenome]|uniref:Peptidase C39-like domain-containing protein n=1 Tax=bioreactor metagenome TaxID=1076179 RepID=A0A644WNK1_9ZZZZ